MLFGLHGTQNLLEKTSQLVTRSQTQVSMGRDSMLEPNPWLMQRSGGPSQCTFERGPHGSILRTMHSFSERVVRAGECTRGCSATVTHLSQVVDAPDAVHACGVRVVL